VFERGGSSPRDVAGKTPSLSSYLYSQTKRAGASKGSALFIFNQFAAASTFGNSS
jgi:hypothetical protein